MLQLKVELSNGSNLHEACEAAARLAASLLVTVLFEFNTRPIVAVPGMTPKDLEQQWHSAQPRGPRHWGVVSKPAPCFLPPSVVSTFALVLNSDVYSADGSYRHRRAGEVFDSCTTLAEAEARRANYARTGISTDVVVCSGNYPR